MCVVESEEQLSSLALSSHTKEHFIWTLGGIPSISTCGIGQPAALGGSLCAPLPPSILHSSFRFCSLLFIMYHPSGSFVWYYCGESCNIRNSIDRFQRNRLKPVASAYEPHILQHVHRYYTTKWERVLCHAVHRSAKWIFVI